MPKNHPKAPCHDIGGEEVVCINVIDDEKQQRRGMGHIERVT